MSDIRQYIKLIEAYEKPLAEGIKFGNKEKKYIISNADKYMVGVEYEFHPNHMNWYYDTYKPFRNSNGSNLYNMNDLTGIEFSDKPVSDYDYNEYTWKVSYDVYTFYVNLTDRVVFENDYGLKTAGQLNDFLVAVIYDLELMNDTPETIPSTFLHIIRDFIKDVDNDAELEIASIIDELDVLTQPNGRKYLTHLMMDDTYGDMLYNAFVAIKTGRGLVSAIGYIRRNISEFKSISPIDILENNHHPLVKYEHAIEPDDKLSLQDALQQHGMADQYNIETDNDQQIELITKETTPIDLALVDINKMLRFINEYGSTSIASGMHVSVSLPSEFRQRKKPNYEKLFMLMSFDFIDKELFPERKHVSSVDRLVREELSELISDESKGFNTFVKEAGMGVKDLYDQIFKMINFERILDDKYQSVNLGTYDLYDGRIELRYFGGEDYEKRFDAIKSEILKALMVVSASYGDMYDKEYRKARYVYIDRIFHDITGMSLPTYIKNLSKD